MTLTANEIAAATAVQNDTNRRLALSDIPGMMCPDSGYPLSADYSTHVRTIAAVTLTTVTALGFTMEQANDLRWRVCFQFEGTREQRIAVMGLSWVSNQEQRGLVPRTSTPVEGVAYADLSPADRAAFDLAEQDQ